MNEQESGAAGEPKPIDFGDEFRRARRNSLIWSGLLILIGIGHSKLAETTPPILNTGLAYTRLELALIAFVVAAYMYIEFVRADRRVRTFSSPAALSMKAGELSTMLGRLVEDTRTALGTVLNAKIQIDQFRTAFDFRINSFVRETSEIYTGPPQLWEQGSPYNRPMIPDELSKETVLIWADARERELEDRFRQIRNGQNQQFNKKLHEFSNIMISDLVKQETAVAISENNISGAVATVAAAAANLSGFHPAIEKSEVRYYRWVDLFAVRAMGVAALISLLMILAGYPLGPLLTTTFRNLHQATLT